jgi:hypothetical protein
MKRLILLCNDLISDPLDEILDSFILGGKVLIILLEVPDRENGFFREIFNCFFLYCGVTIWISAYLWYLSFGVTSTFELIDREAI